MRFLVSCGIDRAEGASFRTAETVPGVKPTCWATTLRVTTADFWRDFLICPMIELVSGPFGSAPRAWVPDDVIPEANNSSCKFLLTEVFLLPADRPTSRPEENNDVS